MRKTSILTLATSIFIAVGFGSAAHATQSRSASMVRAIQDRYCLQGREYGYPGSCTFSTYEQCRASSSGTESGCGVNPRYAFAKQRQ